jgi:hypothetical protein
MGRDDHENSREDRIRVPDEIPLIAKESKGRRRQRQPDTTDYPSVLMQIVRKSGGTFAMASQITGVSYEAIRDCVDHGIRLTAEQRRRIKVAARQMGLRV